MELARVVHPPASHLQAWTLPQTLLTFGVSLSGRTPQDPPGRALPWPVPQPGVRGDTHKGQVEWDSWGLQVHENILVYAEDQEHPLGPGAIWLGHLDSQFQL